MPNKTKKLRQKPYDKRSAKQRAKIEQLQERYSFKLPLMSYLEGATGKPEVQEQKAFYSCLCAEFGDLLGHDVEEHRKKDKKTGKWITTLVDIYRALITATADFFDPHARMMTRYRLMGYQPNTPDFCILVRQGQYSGLIIEMKSQQGRLRPGQKKTLTFLQTQGFSCHGCKGFAPAVEVVLDYFEL